MDARTAIRLLIDEHGDAVRQLSRRQLADRAKVNAGQLSNWLRAEGPLGVEKQGEVAQVVLDIVQASGGSSILAPAVEECLNVLTVFVPRLSVHMSAPDAAWSGERIAHDRPFYVSRYPDEDLVGSIGHGPTRLAVVGGPKTGKSSLLLKVWAACRAASSTIYVDFRQFDGRASANICFWLQEHCEAQIGSEVVGPAVLRDQDCFDEWLERNILPRSRNGRCLLLFDHPETLPQEALKTFDVVLCRHEWSDVKGSCGVILAYDPAHQNLHRLGVRFAEGFRQIPTLALSEHQVQVLARRAYNLDVDGRTVLDVSGGQALLTHALLAEQCGRAPVGTAERALLTMIERMRADWSAEFRRAIADILGANGDGVFNTNRLWQFDALCSGGLFRRCDPPLGVRTASRTVSGRVREQLAEQIVA